MRHHAIRGCQDFYRKEPSDCEVKGIQGPHRQVMELFQQFARGYGVKVRERLHMKVTSPDVAFERRPGVPLVLDGDITSTSTAPTSNATRLWLAG
jgi:hypothetical protein